MSSSLTGDGSDGAGCKCRRAMVYVRSVALCLQKGVSGNFSILHGGVFFFFLNTASFFLFFFVFVVMFVLEEKNLQEIRPSVGWVGLHQAP